MSTLKVTQRKSRNGCDSRQLVRADEPAEPPLALGTAPVGGPPGVLCGRAVFFNPSAIITLICSGPILGGSRTYR